MEKCFNCCEEEEANCCNIPSPKRCSFYSELVSWVIILIFVGFLQSNFLEEKRIYFFLGLSSIFMMKFVVYCLIIRCYKKETDQSVENAFGKRKLEIRIDAVWYFLVVCQLCLVISKLEENWDWSPALIPYYLLILLPLCQSSIELWESHDDYPRCLYGVRTSMCLLLALIVFILRAKKLHNFLWCFTFFWIIVGYLIRIIGAYIYRKKNDDKLFGIEFGIRIAKCLIVGIIMIYYSLYLDIEMIIYDFTIIWVLSWIFFLFSSLSLWIKCYKSGACSSICKKKRLQ
jgi:hypothetical protein